MKKSSNDKHLDIELSKVLEPLEMDFPELRQEILDLIAKRVSRCLECGHVFHRWSRGRVYCVEACKNRATWRSYPPAQNARLD